MGFTKHLYIIFGTNLLTEGRVQIAGPNGMKPSGELFLEQT